MNQIVKLGLLATAMTTAGMGFFAEELAPPIPEACTVLSGTLDALGIEYGKVEATMDAITEGAYLFSVCDAYTADDILIMGISINETRDTNITVPSSASQLDAYVADIPADWGETVPTNFGEASVFVPYSNQHTVYFRDGRATLGVATIIDATDEELAQMEAAAEYIATTYGLPDDG
ncbi:MAG: hypothetical protein AAFR98_08215 [Pseudomonadota bacterium]